MSDLPIGMKHEEVRNKLKQYPKAKRDMLKDSMCNQVRLAEGEGSADTLKKEIDHIEWRGGCDTNFINNRSMTVMGVCIKPCIYKDSIVCDDCFKFDRLKLKEN